MKECPECNEVVKRRAQGKCRNCKTSIYLQKGVYYREEDRQWAFKLLDRLSDHISIRDGMWLDLKADAQEMAFAVGLVHRIRTFLSKQNIKINIYDFILGVLDTILKNTWWAANINSLNQTKNHVEKFVRNCYKVEKEEHIRRTTNIEKNFTGRGHLQINYGVL